MAKPNELVKAVYVGAGREWCHAGPVKFIPDVQLYDRFKMADGTEKSLVDMEADEILDALRKAGEVGKILEEKGLIVGY